MYAHNEQGNYIGEIVFPQVYSNYGTPSYTNGLCFTNTNDWFAWDIDDGMVLLLAAQTHMQRIIMQMLIWMMVVVNIQKWRLFT